MAEKSPASDKAPIIVVKKIKKVAGGVFVIKVNVLSEKIVIWAGIIVPS